jgi:hypothetical protein
VNTVTTELNPASLAGPTGPTAFVVERPRSLAVPRGHAHNRLRRLGGVIGAATVVPMIFMGLAALVLTLLARLLIELLVAGFER